MSYAATARARPGGLVDLSIGTPVDPTPDLVQKALADAADSPGYPPTVGLPDTRQACVDWLARRFGVTGLDADAVLPVIGSKELIASLPTQLGLGADDLVVFPALAYPTYEVGARLAGARTLAADALTSVGPERVSLVWINSPSNPTGRVLPVEHLRHTDVSDGDHTGILAVQSLSKRSNLAGYRCGFVAGDRDVVAELLAVRKNLGLQMPGPQQRAMQAALDDDAHVAEQHERYRRRREVLRAAFEGAGFRVDHSEASLYLWTTRDEPCWDTVGRLAERGVLVAPGEFYGRAGERHVRVAFTATDERVAEAARRLAD